MFTGCLFCGTAYHAFLTAVGEERSWPRGPHPGAPKVPQIAPPVRRYGDDFEGPGGGRGRGRVVALRGSSRGRAGRTVYDGARRRGPRGGRGSGDVNSGGLGGGQNTAQNDVLGPRRGR
jgi:hypothetical protein